jgi:hypothetical protein
MASAGITLDEGLLYGVHFLFISFLIVIVSFHHTTSQSIAGLLSTTEVVIIIKI